LNSSWRTDNPGYLMCTATGLCLRSKLSHIHQAGFGALTDAQLSLFHNIDMRGTRLTDIAARAALTKQSMVELVNKAEKLGMVSRLPDPADKRAKLVMLTDAGKRLIEALKAAIEATEQQMAAATGAPFLTEMKHELAIYAGQSHALGEAQTDERTDLAATGTGAARLLAIATRRFAAEALEVVHRQGFQQVGEVDLALFRNLDLPGSRLTELARRARMTKQSMRELVDRAEARGFVRRIDQAGDARAKIIHFTDAGLSFLERMRAGIEAAERNLAEATASGFVQRLKSGLRGYIQESGGGLGRSL
jgi:DNA-binding MarR family transcriptional regulator